MPTCHSLPHLFQPSTPVKAAPTCRCPKITWRSEYVLNRSDEGRNRSATAGVSASGGPLRCAGRAELRQPRQWLQRRHPTAMLPAA